MAVNLGIVGPGAIVHGSFEPFRGLDGTPLTVTGLAAGLFTSDGLTEVGTVTLGAINDGRASYTFTAPATPGSYLVIATAGETEINYYVVGRVGGSVQVAGSTPTPSPSGPITSSCGMVAVLQQQLSYIAAGKSAALAAIQNTINTGAGPTYSISGKTGSETVDWLGYLTYLRETVREYIELEKLLLELLQDLQPFNVTRHVRIGGSLIGGRLW